MGLTKIEGPKGVVKNSSGIALSKLPSSFTNRASRRTLPRKSYPPASTLSFTSLASFTSFVYVWSERTHILKQVGSQVEKMKNEKQLDARSVDHRSQLRPNASNQTSNVRGLSRCVRSSWWGVYVHRGVVFQVHS